MPKTDISVVVTVFNEAETIIALLDSLAEQTLKPKSIWITDAGSTDETVRQIEVWKAGHSKQPLEVIMMPGANRSRGRNLAIEQVKTSIVAVTDAGCTAKPDWLENLALAFGEPGIRSVAGFYRMKATNDWQKIFQYFLGTVPGKFDPNTYLPSSRSIAFTKEAWGKAGKYPENFDTCEDLVFAAKLKRCSGMAVAQNAIVNWTMPPTLGQFRRQVSSYAQGDIIAGYWPHILKILTVWLRYVLFWWWPSLFIIYVLYSEYKFREKANWRYIPIVQVTADLAVMIGSFQGLGRLIKRGLSG